MRRKTVFGAITALLPVLWLVWCLVPLTETEQRESAVKVVAETRYVVMADTTEVFAFTASRGDTLLNGIGNTSNKAVLTTDTVDAQWVRRWKHVPFSGREIYTEPYDTAALCTFGHDKVKALLQNEVNSLVAMLRIADEQQKDIDYFLRTHTVTDNGFDIVARYGKTLQTEVDSIKKALELVNSAAARENLSIRLDRRLRPLADSIPSGFTAIFHRLPTAQRAHLLLKPRQPKITVLFLSAIDSLGTYDGDRDSIARPHGYGRFLAQSGDFYEGEWQHGKRSGVGFSIVPGKRLRLGEWKDDAFLGERIAYTPERIYGIDISRHQHEKGRKRYGIDWRNLRITSLGTKSKKNIRGTVDYPVRFVYIKATEGVSITNRYYASDYASARKYGYKTGAYHFYSVRTTGKAQADHFLRVARYSKGDLPPVLDLEPSDAQIRQAGGIEALFRSVRAWLDAVESRMAVRPILYISQRFVDKYLPIAPDLMQNYDVWIARYGEYKPNVNLVYWQLSPDGRVKGIHGEVDINVLNSFDFPE